MQTITNLLIASYHLNCCLDDNHTENEISMYNDLIAIRVELKKKQEKIDQLEKEKQEIVAVMHQAAVSFHYF